MLSGPLSHLGIPRPFSGVAFDGLSDAHLCPPRFCDIENLPQGLPAVHRARPQGLPAGPRARPKICLPGGGQPHRAAGKPRGGQRCASDSPSKTTPENGLGMPRCESHPDNKNSYPGQGTPYSGLTGGRPGLKSPLRPLLEYRNQAKCWCANERGTKMHQNPRISSKSINF